jgi:hypothetical protein
LTSGSSRNSARLIRFGVTAMLGLPRWHALRSF